MSNAHAESAGLGQPEHRTDPPRLHAVTDRQDSDAQGNDLTVLRILAAGPAARKICEPPQR